MGIYIRVRPDRACTAPRIPDGPFGPVRLHRLRMGYYNREDNRAASG